MELYRKLELLGISKREAEVYVALLQKREFTAPDLTKITSITRTKVYEHLQNLVRKGFCNESTKNGQKFYRAVKPKIVLQNVIVNYEHEIEQRKKTAIALEKELGEIHNSNAAKDEELEYIEIYKDKSEIRNKFLNLQKDVKKEMLVFNKAPYSITPSENMEYEKDAIKKKITYRSIYEYQDIETKQDKSDFIKVLEMYAKIGETVRLVKTLPIKLAIIDERIAMLALNDPISMKPSITTIIINHPDFAKVQKTSFETFWSNSITIDEYKMIDK